MTMYTRYRMWNITTTSSTTPARYPACPNLVPKMFHTATSGEPS